jgi:hypothetical protein
MAIELINQPVLRPMDFAQGKARAERQFFGGMAAAMAIATFIGFAPTYYLSTFTRAPALGIIVHIHGIVFSTWMLLFLTQTMLVAAERRDLHRKMGIMGALLACSVVVLGVAVAIESGRAGHGPPDRNQPVFLIFPLTLMLIFGSFTTFAIINRQLRRSRASVVCCISRLSLWPLAV